MLKNYYKKEKRPCRPTNFKSNPYFNTYVTSDRSKQHIESDCNENDNHTAQSSTTDEEENEFKQQEKNYTKRREIYVKQQQKKEKVPPRSIRNKTEAHCNRYVASKKSRKHILSDCNENDNHTAQSSTTDGEDKELKQREKNDTNQREIFMKQQQKAKEDVQTENSNLPSQQAVPLLGESLVNYCQLTNAKKPNILKVVVAEIEKRGLNEKDLYDQPGNLGEVNRIINLFENDPWNIHLPKDCNVHSLCSVVKRYLKMLPEPLITYPTYSGFISLAKDFTKGDKSTASIEKRLQRLLNKQPLAHAETLSLIIRHFGRIEKKCTESGINMDDVLSCFFLSTIRPPVYKDYILPQECQEDLIHQKEVLKILLQFKHVTTNIQQEDFRKKGQAKTRFFRIPFVYRDDDKNAAPHKGFYYAEFNDSRIARQLELHPGKSPVVLVSGKDDARMCQPELELTRLVEKPEIEIRERSFAKAWTKFSNY